MLRTVDNVLTNRHNITASLAAVVCSGGKLFISIDQRVDDFINLGTYSLYDNNRQFLHIISTVISRII